MTGKTLSLQDNQLRARMCRLLDGEYITDDVAKLFAGKRFASRGRAAFREIGDFAAHPDMRDKGPVTQSLQDMKLIMAPMLDDADGRKPSKEAQCARVKANLRMATDEQIRRLYPGFTLKRAEKLAESGLSKVMANKHHEISDDERFIVNHLAGSMLWNPRITADRLFEEFVLVMLDNDILKKDEVDRLKPAKTFITLYVLTVLHGVGYKLPDKNRGELQVGFGNAYGVLEVTASILLQTAPKRMDFNYTSLFTTLLGREHCGETLVDRPGPWSFPIELRDGKIEPIGDIPPPEPENPRVAKIMLRSSSPQSFWPYKVQ